tara:strand:- start:153 stop:758 length:606 start_codon:yes stop_codon:yes gene_type:complete
MKKIVVFSLLILIFYSLGILTYRYQLPPYEQIRFVFRTFLPKPNQKFQVDEKIYSQYLKKRNLVLSDFEELPDLKMVKYSPGMNIWSDRAYYNQKNDEKIYNSFLIKQKRHNYKNIVIYSKEDLEIIRVKCMLNNNSEYKNWEKLNYDLLIIGSGCIHDEVFKKKYKAGEITIFSGGPIASDPIFIIDQNSKIEILSSFEF